MRNKVLWCLYVLFLTSFSLGVKNYFEIKTGFCVPTERQGFKFKNFNCLSCELGKSFDSLRISIAMELGRYKTSNNDGETEDMLSARDKNRFTRNSLLFNLYRDFQMGNSYSFYLGGGIGVSRIKFEAEDAAEGFLYEDSKFCLVGQLVTGFYKNITANWGVGMGYRFIKISNRHFRDDKSTIFQESSMRLSNIHCFEIGLRYTFDKHKFFNSTGESWRTRPWLSFFVTT